MIDFELPAELAAAARSGANLHRRQDRSVRERSAADGAWRAGALAPGTRRLGAGGRAICRRTRRKNMAASGSIIAAWRWSSRPPAGRRWGRWRSTSRRLTRATSICSMPSPRLNKKARWLAPLVRGEIRSVFSMTETVSDGAGSDPSLLNTVAQQDGDGFLITGKKYMITGVPDAAINIVMARTLDPYGKDLGATMFFVDLDAPGFASMRMLDTIDSNSPGGHAEVSFDRVRVHAGSRARRGRPGLPQCPGSARPGTADALHALARCGAALPGDRGGTRQAPAFVRHAPSASTRAWASCSPTTRSSCICRDWRSGMPRGCSIRATRRATRPAMTKVFCSEALGRVVDRCLQILGAIGITRDTVVERIYPRYPARSASMTALPKFIATCWRGASLAQNDPMKR